MSVDKNRQVDRWGSLMRAAQAGDDASYRQLLRELAGAFRIAARGKLTRYGRGNADQEDIVQEALLAIHLKRGTWDASRPFAPWAHAVLAHKLADRVRHARIRDHDTLDVVLEYAVADEPETTASSDVERMLDRLEATPRRIVSAISIEGRSAAEVAGEIGSTEGAVRVALHRALKRLAAWYREEKQ